MGMIGKKNKPFCGDCCSEYRQGSGKRHKRILKKINKAKEKRLWFT
jgi:hypothetical protein